MVTSAVPQDARGAVPDGEAAPTPARRRRWRGRPRPELMPKGEWPALIASLFAMRGITDASTAARFIDPPERRPSAGALPAIDVAVDRLLQATRAGSPSRSSATSTWTA